MLSRRAKEGGAATVDPPAGPAAAAGRTVHHSKSMPAHLAAVSASEWLDGEGGAPSGRRRGSTLLKWACVLLALLVLLRHALRPGAGGYTHTSFVTVEGSQVGVRVTCRVNAQGLLHAACCVRLPVTL